ncbi:unnamed protein product [Trichobilharzia regenti]|nr:unnamed protein product [Trichobilharzia regenti]
MQLYVDLFTQLRITLSVNTTLASFEDIGDACGYLDFSIIGITGGRISRTTGTRSVYYKRSKSREMNAD